MKRLALLLIVSSGCRGEYVSYDDGEDSETTVDVPSTNAEPSESSSGAEDSGTTDTSDTSDTTDATDTSSTTDDSTTDDSTTDDSTTTGDGDGDGDTGAMLLGENEPCDPLNENEPNGLCEDGLVCSGPFWDQFNSYFEFRCQDPGGDFNSAAYGTACFASFQCPTGMGCVNEMHFPQGICGPSVNCCMPLCKQENAECPPNTVCDITYSPVNPEYMSAGYGFCSAV